MIKYVYLFLVLFVPFLSATPNWARYKKQALPQQKTVQGWCTEAKAEKLMNLIYKTHPKICVEIGVFGGSSIYPTAAALQFLNEGGVIYAIDPWEKVDCLVGYEPNDANFKWWNMINLEMVYQDFLKMVNDSGFSNYCHVMRMPSLNAVSNFLDGSIDILHIDGNHTEAAALMDAELFLPKVKVGGYIWFDAANWSSTNKAIAFLKEHCVFDVENSAGNECLLFHKL